MNSEIFLIFLNSLCVFNLHSAWFPAFLDTLVIEVLTPVGSSVVALRLKNLFFTTFEEKDMDIIVEGKSLVLILLSASLGKDGISKSDEFLEKFQTAFEQSWYLARPLRPAVA